MPAFDVALSWIVLAPISFLANIVCIIFVLHYQPLFHSCDVALISLLVTMATNAVFIFPVQAVVELGELTWSRELCTFYVWLTVTLRASNFLVLLVVNVYWMASLRVTLRGKLFTTSKSAKMCVCIAWLVSILLGIIPATGGVDMFPYFNDGACKFLPANTSYGFALVFVILPLLSFVMGLISSVDSWILFRHIRSVVLSRSNAGRFRATNSTSSAQHAAHDSHNQLNLSTDLCRLVIAFTVVSSALNGLPLMVSQFVQMIQDHDRVAMETTLLYLLLIEALVLPHLIWLLSDRYRHAAYYTWKVFVVRDQSYREEDASACVLQAFRLQSKTTTTRRHNNGTGPPQVNGNANSIQENELRTVSAPRTSGSNGHPRRPDNLSGASETTRGRMRTIMTTDLDDGMTVITQVTASSTPEQDHGNVFETLAVPDISVPPQEVKTKVAPKKSPRNFNGVKKVEANGTSAPVAMETLQKVTSADVSRSSSASREEWKVKMRKKYLPAVLLDEISDQQKQIDLTSQGNCVDIELVDEVVTRKSAVTHSPSVDSNYYISGDYHYSYLGDSGASATLKREVTLQEDGMYESCDIISVLEDAQGGNDPHVLVNGVIYAQLEKTPSSDNGPVVDVVSNDLTGNQVADADRVVWSSPVNHDSPLASQKEFLGSLETTGMTNVIGIEFGDKEEEILAELQAEMRTEKPKDMIENTETLKSFIRRDNYRKFLPYTNLIVSSVDVDDGQAIHLPVSNIDVLPAGQVEAQKFNDADPVTEVDAKGNRVDDVMDAAGKSLPRQDAGSHILVEYNHLENVSGTEMLLLKMKKVRQAIAMDSTDDSNYSANSSNDWSSDTNDQSGQPPPKAVASDSMSTSTTLHENSESKSQLKEVADSTLKNPVLKSPTQAGGLSENVQVNAVKITSINTDSLISKSTLDNVQRFKQARYSNNPFLTESFELSQNSERNRHTNLTNPFISPHDIFIGPEVIEIFQGPVASGVGDVPRVPATRLKKNRQNSVKSRHTSSEDELDSIFEERLTGSSGSFDNPFSPSEPQAKNDETDSDASDRSVIIKPYGRRRPAWMEDPLMTTNQDTEFNGDQLTSESDTDTLGDSNHFTTFSVTVTDDNSDAVVEYDFDAVNIGGSENNDTLKTFNYLKALNTHPNIVQYHFDEDIDRGFEDALSVNYVSQGHAFGGLGLCFESIKEEPEESLSESLTSLDGMEFSDSKNIFKTQAVVSRPSSRASATSPELSFPPHSLFQDDFDGTPTKNFPAFERTSADGSEEVIFNANGNNTPPKNPLDPWGFAQPVTSAQKPGTLALTSQFSVDFENDAIEIERADDIVTSLVFHPERSSPFGLSDWTCDTLLTPPDSYQNPIVKTPSTSPRSANSKNVSFNTTINSAYF